MNKMQTANQKRIDGIMNKWRADNGDSAAIESRLAAGRTPTGYTDNAIGRLAKTFDEKGRLSIAQMTNVRQMQVAPVVAAVAPVVEEAPKPKRKYTRKTIGETT